MLAQLAMLPDFDSIYRFDMDSGFIFTSLWSNSFTDDFMADYIPEAEISMLAPRATLPEYNLPQLAKLRIDYLQTVYLLFISH